MRFLIDENLSRRLVGALTSAGHDAIHVNDLGLSSAQDEEVLQTATAQRRILVSADTDFGTVLAATRATTPSMLLVRRISHRRADELAALMLANLDDVADALRQGAVVVVEETRIRVRLLPLA